ncbi:MAG: TIGR01777 family oxidoreductase [Bacteroidia bacterium]|nr:TIGR01777 family protein [Bacteroidia bacterium]MCZ2276443.1 TIGR01777 family oxidoreductase [Bacteroidia bacterium]
MNQRVLIAGGSGLVGKKLTEILSSEGYDVSILTRKKSPLLKIEQFEWDPVKNKIDDKAFENVRILINLAGAGIADKRWTANRKQEIIRSRTSAAAALYDFLNSQSHQIQVVIHASAIGIYKNNLSELLDESAVHGNDFISSTVIEWEKQTTRFSELKIRTVIFRFGIILSADDGAFNKMLKPLRFRIAGIVGTGRQMMSWVHIEDTCRAIIYAIKTDSMSGIYNLVSPYPVSNQQLMQELIRQKKGVFLKAYAPSFALRLILGQRAEILLNGAIVSSKKLVDKGFRFRFPEIAPAIANLLKAR